MRTSLMEREGERERGRERESRRERESARRYSVLLIVKFNFCYAIKLKLICCLHINNNKGILLFFFLFFSEACRILEY